MADSSGAHASNGATETMRDRAARIVREGISTGQIVVARRNGSLFVGFGERQQSRLDPDNPRQQHAARRGLRSVYEVATGVQPSAVAMQTMLDVLIHAAESAEEEPHGAPAASGEEDADTSDRIVLDDDADVVFERDAEGEPDPRPKIYISTELHEVVAQANDAILALPDCPIYRRGDVLVELVREPGQAPRSRQLPLDCVAPYCTQAAVWFKNAGGVWFPTVPGNPICKAILAQLPWEFPELSGFTTVPALRPDGSVLYAPGYDAASGLLYDPCGVSFAEIPEHPSDGDVREAVRVLLDPLCDFPFVDESGCSVAISLLLTLLARGAIRGATPLFAVDGNKAGAGKGLLIDYAAIAALGQRIHASTLPIGWRDRIDASEVRKELLAHTLEGTPLLVYDNVAIPIDSPELSAHLTAEYVTGRILGVSRTGRARRRTVPAVTGNGLRWSEEVRRRVVLAQLWTELEKPEERSGLRYPRLREHLASIRRKLVWAGLVLLRAHAVKGWPDHGRPPLGGFEEWDRWVRGAVIGAGLPDPCSGRLRLQAGSSPDQELLTPLLPAWHAAFGSARTTVARLVGRAPDDPVLRRALGRLDPVQQAAGGGGDLDRTAIGRSLARLAPASAGGFRLEVLPELVRGGVRAYVVTPDEEARPEAPDTTSHGRAPTGPAGPVDSAAPRAREGSEGWEGLPLTPPPSSSLSPPPPPPRGVDSPPHVKQDIGGTPPTPPTPPGGHGAGPLEAPAVSGDPYQAQSCGECGETDRWRGAYVQGCDPCREALQPQPAGRAASSSGSRTPVPHAAGDGASS